MSSFWNENWMWKQWKVHIIYNLYKKIANGCVLSLFLGVVSVNEVNENNVLFVTSPWISSVAV
jgi:hypothetical protein